MSKVTFHMHDNMGREVLFEQLSDTKFRIISANGVVEHYNFPNKMAAMYLRQMCDNCIQRSKLGHDIQLTRYPEVEA